MLEISELIYETCKTYLVTQGKFIMVLWAFIAVIIAALLRMAVAGAGQAGRGHAAHHSWCSAWSASRAATAWRGSAFA